MKKVLIVGAGGVGSVVAHKCAEVPEVFSNIMVASRRLASCERIQAQVRELRGRDVSVAQLDADDVGQTVRLIGDFRPDIVINVALPYQDLPLMDACLETGVDYLDTANYEPPDVAKFEYAWQWAYHDRFKEKGIMALLGAGFDPGVTNVFCAYAQEELFDEIHTIDILDCNAGSHGHPFATNFNAEINLREITQRGRYWEEGRWNETDPLSQRVTFDFPQVGERNAYLLYHEELESLVKNIRGLRRIRFYMTFSDEYLTHLRVLQNVRMTSIDPVDFEGHKIVPLKFLKALLPDPAGLGSNYKGKTCIGCHIDGTKNGKARRIFIYNVSDHAKCYAECRSQAISYTTGVPATLGAIMMVTGKWRMPGTVNLEQLDPAPFLEALERHGLPWHVEEM
jgi:saccharopine dehydrogenase (NAD+, L-lysine forming)